jgi:hypothetical protein
MKEIASRRRSFGAAPSATVSETPTAAMETEADANAAMPQKAEASSGPAAAPALAAAVKGPLPTPVKQQLKQKAALKELQVATRRVNATPEKQQAAPASSASTTADAASAVMGVLSPSEMESSFVSAQGEPDAAPAVGTTAAVPAPSSGSKPVKGKTKGPLPTPVKQQLLSKAAMKEIAKRKAASPAEEDDMPSAVEGATEITSPATASAPASTRQTATSAAGAPAMTSLPTPIRQQVYK